MPYRFDENLSMLEAINLRCNDYFTNRGLTQEQADRIMERGRIAFDQVFAILDKAVEDTSDDAVEGLALAFVMYGSVLKHLETIMPEVKNGWRTAQALIMLRILKKEGM